MARLMTARAFTRFDKYCTETNVKELITWLRQSLPAVCQTLKLTSRQATKFELELSKLVGQGSDDKILAAELTNYLSGYSAERWDKVKSRFRKHQFDKSHKRVCLSLSTYERLIQIIEEEKLESVEDAITILIFSYKTNTD